jgi:hypothetical protein
MVFTTGSNPENAYKCRKLHRFMLREEEEYFSQRKEFIRANANSLSETETILLAGLSQGKIYPDILKMLDSYQKTGKLPPLPDDAFNTCDPETGSWTERIVPLKTYEQAASQAGFRATFASGFYNEERSLKVMFFVFRILNFCIKKLGKFGFKFAPYLLIKLSPKHGVV